MTLEYRIQSPYERQARFELDEVLPFVGQAEKKDFNGNRVSLISTRYQVFARSIFCVSCGIAGSYFALERNTRKIITAVPTLGKDAPQHRISWAIDKRASWHLNLYAINADSEVMMTQDHIIPRALGGLHKLYNLQTMCRLCNRLKGATLPEGFLLITRIIQPKLAELSLGEV